MFEDLKYTAKLVRGVLSGFDDLQRQVDGWEYVEYTIRTTRDWRGERGGGISYDLPDNPYYVCVAWNNRSHTPLPIVLDADSEYKLQNMVVRFLCWLHTRGLCGAAWEAATIACAYYAHQFEEEYPPVAAVQELV